MPAAVGTAATELTPGTTSNGTPASASASASSPPRPNTNGSPPLSRTTSRPARPWPIEELLHLVLVEAIAGNPQGMRRRLIDELVSDQVVVDDDVAALQQPQPMNRDQTGIAGAR